jgi:hypothetical protein
VDLQLGAVFGLVFGVLAGACAYAIAYHEHKRNWSFRGNKVTASLQSAMVAFVFFFVAALVLVIIFRAVAK